MQLTELSYADSDPQKEAGNTGLAPGKSPRRRIRVISKHVPAPAQAPATVNIERDQLARHMRAWLLDCEIAQLASSTRAGYTITCDRLLWYMDNEARGRSCSTSLLKSFFSYISTAHLTPGGRWGKNTKQPSLRKAPSPRTVGFYYTNLRTFFRTLVNDEQIPFSPMDLVPKIKIRSDQPHPFSADQIRRLLAAAAKTRYPERDKLIILMLLDTGMRSMEIISLTLDNIDLESNSLYILGKGQKRRTVYYGRDTKKALLNYLRTRQGVRSNEPIFVSDRGINADQPLTRSGLYQLIERFGEACAMTEIRCSPHTFRHTFAIMFLRAGGNVFSLKELLGHTSLTMVNKYLQLADADLENQHRKFSPVESLKKKP